MCLLTAEKSKFGFDPNPCIDKDNFKIPRIYICEKEKELKKEEEDIHQKLICELLNQKRNRSYGLIIDTWERINMPVSFYEILRSLFLYHILCVAEHKQVFEISTTIFGYIF